MKRALIFAAGAVLLPSAVVTFAVCLLWVLSHFDEALLLGAGGAFALTGGLWAVDLAREKGWIAR